MSEHAPHREATYEDLLKVPDHLVAEIVDGELYTSPRPGYRHTQATTALAADLIMRFQRGTDGPGGWAFLFEPELHLGRDILVPDIAGWRGRSPASADAAFFTAEPDWVCETVSVGTARLDRAKKLPRYARYGVGHAWIVDPVGEYVEVYRLTGELFSLASTHVRNDKMRAEPFDACEIDLSAYWIDA